MEYIIIVTDPEGNVLRAVGPFDVWGAAYAMVLELRYSQSGSAHPLAYHVTTLTGR